MTRDEILSMEAGREMDALIAEKVMGYTRKMAFGGEAWTLHSSKYIALPDFSTSDFDVLAVVDKMSETYDVVISVYKGLTSCKILKEVADDWKFEMIIEQIYASTPLAICKAALLAVMEE